MHDPASWFRKTWFTRRRVQELKNAHNFVTVQNRTHVYMNFFHHKDLGNHLLQLCPKVVKHPVYYHIVSRCVQWFRTRACSKVKYVFKQNINGMPQCYSLLTPAWFQSSWVVGDVIIPHWYTQAIMSLREMTLLIFVINYNSWKYYACFLISCTYRRDIPGVCIFELVIIFCTFFFSENVITMP